MQLWSYVVPFLALVDVLYAFKPGWRVSANLKMMGQGFGKPSSSPKQAKSPSSEIIPRSIQKQLVDESSPTFRPISSDLIQFIAFDQVPISNYSTTFNLQFPNLRCISSNPPIFEIDSFLSPEICDQYVNQAAEKGTKIASQTFSAVTQAARTSTTWYMHYKDVKDFLSNTLKLTGAPLENCEEPQIVRYEMGQQFSWHYDAIPKSLLENGGQRRITLIVYLNDAAIGGATCFKDLSIKVQPKKGKALLFFPSFLDGTSDDRTMHAGQVAMDTKWIAQMWIHEKPYRPNLPDGNNHDEARALL